MPICLVNLWQGWHGWHSWHWAWEEAHQKYGLQLRHCGSRANSTWCASRTFQRCNLPVGEEWRSWRELPGTDLLKALQTYRYRTKSASTDFSFGMFWVESHWGRTIPKLMVVWCCLLFPGWASKPFKSRTETVRKTCCDWYHLISKHQWFVSFCFLWEALLR